jgi:hypothetical protein
MTPTKKVVGSLTGWSWILQISTTRSPLPLGVGCSVAPLFKTHPQLPIYGHIVNCKLAL